MYSLGNTLEEIVNNSGLANVISFTDKEIDLADLGNFVKDFNCIYIPKDNKSIKFFYIDMPIGYGLLDYISLDLSKLLATNLLSLDFDKFEQDIKDYQADKTKYDLSNDKLNAEYIKFNQDTAMSYLKPILIKHNYLRRFKPYIKNDYKTGLSLYIIHLLVCSGEFEQLVRFCLDVNYKSAKARNEEGELVETSLIGKTSKERFALYINTFLGFKIPNISLCVNSASIQNFCDENDLDFESWSNSNSKKNKDILYVYECNSLKDMLFLEFYLMLENNIKVKVCQNCGKYFPYKGNTKTDYCKRYFEGTNHNCQQAAANKAFKEKLNNSEAMQLYNKYYRRFSARVRSGTLDYQDFNKWKFKAITLRDECVNEKYSLVDYVDFLEGSFRKD